MFARNVSLSTTVPKFLPARRKMGLSDAIRYGSGEAARRGADTLTSASMVVQREDRWPIEGVCVDWQLEEPRAS